MKKNNNLRIKNTGVKRKMDAKMRKARKNFRTLSRALKGKKKKNGDKKELADAITKAYTVETLAKFVVKEGIVNRLAKSRIT